MELGRLDGKSFNRAIVKHVLPGPGFNLDQLNSLFAQNGLTQTDMIALSGKHKLLFLLFSPFLSALGELAMCLVSDCLLSGLVAT